MKNNINSDSSGLNNKIQPEKWISRYDNKLITYTKVRVRNNESVKDIVSETYIAALRAIPSFKGKCSESTFLFSILRKKIVDYYRYKNTKKYQSQISMSQILKNNNHLEDIIYSTNNESPDHLIIHKELEQALDRFLLTLSDKQANVFSLKTIQGLTTYDISDRLSIERNHIWVINHTVRKKLRTFLAVNGAL